MKLIIGFIQNFWIYHIMIIRQLNAELEKKGIITLAGRVSRRYFIERLCYGEVDAKAEERRR